MSLLVGEKLGPYEIVALLSADGRGEVYRARDLWLGRKMAIKLPPQQFSEWYSSHHGIIAAKPDFDVGVQK
jgi:hypothetical protein